jgi:Fic family protein
MRIPQTPPAMDAVLRSVTTSGDPSVFGRILGMEPVLADGEYLHWDELRRRAPPDGLSREQWWLGIKLKRTNASHPIVPLAELYGLPFGFVPTASVERALHELDRTNVGSEILSALGNPDAKAEYRVRQLIEEAISSSEIEGARPTTRELARQMLREKRPPSTRDERMIANNLRAMERLCQLHAEGRALTIEHLLELHRILGEGALEVAGAEGQFRSREHEVTVVDARGSAREQNEDVEGNVWHRPPDADGLEQRVARLLAFANGSDDGGKEFVHPIVRAIVTHFWLGYEHPFRDGNGRIARALFYWCMLRQGYEMAEFLSISGPIDRSPKGYYLAFSQVETDGGDLTYFILHQLGVIRKALDDLLVHLKARAVRLRQLAEAVAHYDELNHRQRSLLEHAIRHPSEGQTIEGQATSHGVHYLTARSDLAALVQRGLLIERKIGTRKRFYPSPSFMEAGIAIRER